MEQSTMWRRMQNLSKPLFQSEIKLCSSKDAEEVYCKIAQDERLLLYFYYVWAEVRLFILEQRSFMRKFSGYA